MTDQKKARLAYTSAQEAIILCDSAEFNRIVTKNSALLKTYYANFFRTFSQSLMFSVSFPFSNIHRVTNTYTILIIHAQMLLTMYRIGERNPRNYDQRMMTKLTEYFGDDEPIIQQLRAALIAQELED